MQPDLNLRRQRLAAQLSETVTAKPLGQLFLLIYIYILIKKEERERPLERGKNDHRNPAGNRTRDLPLSGRLLYQLSYWATPISLYVFSADPQRLFLFLYFLVSVPTLWTQGNCLGWGPSDRTGLAGTEYHRTLNCVERALQSLPRRQLF